MRVLIACEESQEVCKAFRELGHEAFSCDVLECSGGHPEWHIQDDVLKHLDDCWDLMIAHPPCTYLCVTSNRWLKEQPARKSGKLVGKERVKAQQEAVNFFIELWMAKIPFIAIENPVGIMSTRFIKPHQIIHPYYFGDAVSKKTCLWLKNLPLLRKTNVVQAEYHTTKSGKKYPKWSMIDACKIQDLEKRASIRSKTFLGIAKAMANQWGNFVEDKLTKNKKETKDGK